MLTRSPAVILEEWRELESSGGRTDDAASAFLIERLREEYATAVASRADEAEELRSLLPSVTVRRAREARQREGDLLSSGREQSPA